MWLKESKEYKEKLDRIYKDEPLKLKEKKWKYEVPKDLAKGFAKQINSDDPDFEEIRKVLKEILTFVRDKVGEDDFFEEDLIEDLDWADFDTEEDVDYYIDEMYDVLDGYNVWMEPASFFDNEDEEEGDDEEESDDEEDFDESCKMKESTSDKFENLVKECRACLDDWGYEDNEPTNNRFVSFTKKVALACEMRDLAMLKKLAYDYADFRRINPVFDDLVELIKSSEIKESCDKMKEAEEKFVIQYYDVNKDSWYVGDPEEGSYVTEDAWSKDPKEALLFDTEEEALACLEDIDDHLLHNDPEYPSFKMRVKKISL